VTTTAVGATTSAAEPASAGGRPLSGAAVRLGGLFDEHAALVLGLCRSLLRNAHDAEDAAQQTFLSAYRSLLSGNEPREPAAWLATIARHECGTRSQQRMREPLPSAEYEQVGGDDPFDATVKRADVESLRLAVAQLPRQQRQAFVLREFSGFSYDELAVALGVSGPAVESLLFRARRQIRLLLRSALAPANGLLWLPLRLRDLLSSAPEAPVAAKLASATGVVLVSTSAVALVPHGPHRQHQERPVSALVATPRHAAVRAAPRTVAPRPSTVEPVSSTFARTEGRVAEGSRSSAGERDRSRTETQTPEDRSTAQQVKRNHSGEGVQASSGGPTTSAEIESASEGDVSSGVSGSSSDSGSGSDSSPTSDSSSSSDSASSVSGD
jgi:RNA polymerase sigma-70 factor (ECF subfamily)